MAICLGQNSELPAYYRYNSVGCPTEVRTISL